MHWDLFARYCLDFFALLPGAVICFAPVWEWIRTPRRTLPAIGAGLAVLMLADAAVCAFYQWNSNWFLLAELAVLFPLYHHMLSPTLSRWRTAFSFLMGTWLLEVSVLLSMVVNARAELSNTQSVCLFSTAGLCLVFIFGLGLFYCAFAVPWVSWLLRTFPFQRIWHIAWIPPALCTACYVFFLPRDPALVLKNLVQAVAILAILISLLLVFLLLYVFYRSGKEYMARLKLAQENHLLAMESQRYQELRAYVEHTRVLRHDFRQHLHVIVGLAEAGQLAQLQKYLRRYEDELSEARPTLCANAALDAIAGHYAAEARRKQIPAVWQISLPETLPLPEDEFCTMLGNLLENALRASCVLPPERRRLSVNAQMLSPAMLGLMVENTYDSRPNATPSGEGIGLTSVKTVVQKYNGSMTVETENDVFRISILLNFKSIE